MSLCAIVTANEPHLWVLNSLKLLHALSGSPSGCCSINPEKCACTYTEWPSLGLFSVSGAVAAPWVLSALAARNLLPGQQAPPYPHQLRHPYADPVSALPAAPLQRQTHNMVCCQKISDIGLTQRIL